MNTTYETEDLSKLALGARAGRSARLRRALVARLLNEQAESGEENGDAGTEGGDEDERQLAKLLVGSRLLRRRRVRRLVLAHLLNARGEGEGEEEFEDEDAEGEEEGGDDDRSVARLLIGSRMLRRRRVRRVLLAHLIKQRGDVEDVEGEGDSDEDFEDDEGGEGGGDRKFAKLVIGSRILRRRRVRRAVLAKLLNS